MFGPLCKVGASCVAIALVTAAATFVVVTHIAPGERHRDPRLTAPQRQNGW
ncbi:hypothetical protein [Mycobacteroides franklinii]|uniref:hypothetical protein n=1 Tax=Mycobacteroides franklinii TaxID=948102 RepID=UPI0013FD3826|nr:hypothetical protein [Mycobacteroides franklinii]